LKQGAMIKSIGSTLGVFFDRGHGLANLKAAA
jgi:hypothetical protein